MVARRVIGLLLFLGAPLMAAAELWTEDFNDARKAAAAANKLILVDVTGSDWCPPCQWMEAEVFEARNFATEVGSRFVLFKMDFPRKIQQREAVRAQNKKLAELHPFEGFPTFFLMDADGKVWARHSGYLKGGVQAFADLTKQWEHQKTTLTDLLQAADKAAPGEPRARALDTLFQKALGIDLESEFAELPVRIVQEDRDGKAGLRENYRIYNAYRRILTTWSANDDGHKTVTELDSMATKVQNWPYLQQRILFTEGMVYLNALSDDHRAAELFNLSRNIDPNSMWGLRASQFLDHLP